MRGAERLLKCLEKEGVDIIFGYPGGQAITIFDALYDSPITNILVRHEQAAAHAADGYARSTGKVGVCLATSGPGATNLVTGIATAYMDSVPMVAITGQVGTGLIGTDAFQEADITGITLPITKYNYLVEDIHDLPRIVKEAFYLAGTGRPGPVVIDVPKNIQEGQMDYDPDAEVEMKLPGYKLSEGIDPTKVTRAVAALKKAQKPIFYVGGGVINGNASAELKELAEKMQIPVATTLMGLGAFPEDHPLSLGMLGMHGSRYANYAISECDVMLAAGVRFDDRVTGKLSTFAPNAQVIHMDIDQAEISKNVEANIAMVGEVKDSLKAITEALGDYKVESSDWCSKLQNWKQQYPLTYKEPADGAIMPQYVIEQLYELTKGDIIMATEVGQHQMWAAQHYTHKHPRCFISSGGLGTMSYGFPASIGAAVGNPGKKVINIAGDGSIQMNIQELITAVQYKLPVIVCILNNQFLGMVRQWQGLFYGGRYSSTDISCQPDFVKVAEAYGALGIRVEKKEDVKAALKQALEHEGGPVFIDFVVEREANVFPMVPPGASLIDMVGGE